MIYILMMLAFVASSLSGVAAAIAANEMKAGLARWKRTVLIGQLLAVIAAGLMWQLKGGAS